MLCSLDRWLNLALCCSLVAIITTRFSLLFRNLLGLGHKLLARLEDHLNGEGTKAAYYEYSDPQLRQNDIEDDTKVATDEEKWIDNPNSVVINLGL